MSETEMKKYCSMAIKERDNAYSPYSNISVGAVLVTKDGKIYCGANIENASFTPTVCAERVAFFKAVNSGERHFSKIFIAGGKCGEPSSDYFPPCGVCRQVMAEFCNDDFEVILVKEDGYKKITFPEILPYRFDSNFM